jgi:hypothetical protein
VKELSLSLAVTLGAIATANGANAQTAPTERPEPVESAAEQQGVTAVAQVDIPAIAPVADTAAIEFSAARSESIPMAAVSNVVVEAVPIGASLNGGQGAIVQPDLAAPEYSAPAIAQQSLAVEPASDGSKVLRLQVPAPMAPTAESAAISPSSTHLTPSTSEPPAFMAPATSQVPAPMEAPPTSAEDRLQSLEQQQNQLKQEIESLRRQLATPNTANTLQVPEPDLGNLTFSTQLLFLKPHLSSNMDYAIVDPGVALATSGELKDVEFRQSDALRFALTYELPKSAWDVGVTHTTYDTRGDSSATRPDFATNPAARGFLFSTLTVPFQNDRADTAAASANLEFATTDLDVGYRFRIGKGLETRLFAGWRFGNLERDMAATYNGQSFRNAEVRISDDFNGSGPRVGAELRVPLGSGLSLFGRGAASILFGKSSTRFVETNVDGTDLIADLGRDVSQTVPVLDMALGVDLTMPLNAAKTSSLSVSAGYEYQHWFNVVNNIRFVNASNPGAFTDNQGDLSLQGFFLKAGLSFTF